MNLNESTLLRELVNRWRNAGSSRWASGAERAFLFSAADDLCELLNLLECGSDPRPTAIPSGMSERLISGNAGGE